MRDATFLTFFSLILDVNFGASDAACTFFSLILDVNFGASLYFIIICNPNDSPVLLNRRQVPWANVLAHVLLEDFNFELQLGMYFVFRLIASGDPLFA